MKRIVTHLSLLAATAILATGCAPIRHNLPPEQRLLEPGPGVGGPGPGVLGPPSAAPMMTGAYMGGGQGMPGPSPADAVAMRNAFGGPQDAQIHFASYGGGCGPECGEGSVQPVSNTMLASSVMMGAGGVLGAPATVQVTFGQPEGMQLRYDATGSGTFDSEPLVVPARQNFPQGGIYRVKLTNIPTREGVELYPTVELAYSNPRTGAYLAHNSVPIQFTEEDFDQVLTGNFVTKVIYLPDPDFQGPALAGIDTLVSTRLDPGIDPIVEADRRGSILAIIRLGDKDIEMPGATGGIAAGMYPPPIAGLPAPFAPSITEGCGGAEGQLPMGLPGMISGVNAPQYGMPRSGTPIGLTGPPHLPFGHPAGLTKHVMRNHTRMHLPRPVDNIKMDVRLAPGYSYPNPVSRVNISEHNINPGIPLGRGLHQHSSQRVGPIGQ